jgi:branched-chain amino acid transport system substrate-binding protein
MSAYLRKTIKYEERMMKKLIYSLLIMLIVLAFLGCTAQPTQTNEPVVLEPETEEPVVTEAPVVMDPYRIGVFLRFSDEAGTKMQKTITKAFDDINAANGINGHLIDVVFYDTEGDSAKGIDAFTRLVNNDKVLMTIGPTTSGVALAVIDLANEYKTVMITPQSTNTKITAEFGNEWFFRNSVADIYHSYTLCDYIVNDMGLTKIAFMHETASLGLGQYENFTARLKNKYNLEPVIVQEWNEGDVDFKTQLLAVKASEPEIIVLAGHEAELAIVVSQRLEVGLSKALPVAGFSSMSSADFYGVAQQAAVGAIFSTTFSPTDPRSDIQAFVTAYTPAIGAKPDHNSAQAYDTVQLVAQVLAGLELGNTEETLAADRLAIRDALAQVRGYVGLSGVTTFGPGTGPEDRDGKKNSMIYQLQADYTWVPLMTAK